MGEAPIGNKKGDQQCGRHKDWSENQPEREKCKSQACRASCVDALEARGIGLL